MRCGIDAKTRRREGSSGRGVLLPLVPSELGGVPERLRRARAARLRAAIDLILRRALGGTKYFLRRASLFAMRLSSRKSRRANSSSSGTAKTIRVAATPWLSREA